MVSSAAAVFPLLPTVLDSSYHLESIIDTVQLKAVQFEVVPLKVNHKLTMPGQRRSKIVDDFPANLQLLYLRDALVWIQKGSGGFELPQGDKPGIGATGFL